MTIDNVKMLILVACGGPTPLTPPIGLKSLPPSLMSYCVKPFLKCGAFLHQQKEKAAGNMNGNSNLNKTSAAASVAARRGIFVYCVDTERAPSGAAEAAQARPKWLRHRPPRLSLIYRW